MLFDSLMLTRIAADIRRQAMGARVDRVFQPARDEVALELRRKLPRPQIILSWSAEYGRAHLGGTAEPRPDLHLPIGDVLRKHLRGATLVDCRQVAFDRLLRLEFANCAGMGPQSRATLVAEIMGRHANLVLLNEQGTILACAKHVTAEVNRYRETVPGLEYIPPPAFDRLHPADVTASGLQRLAAETEGASLRAMLRKNLMGASDLLMDETLARAGLPDAPPASLPEDWQERTCAALAGMLTEAEAGAEAYVYMEQAEGPDTRASAAFAYPLALVSTHGLEPDPAADLSEALECLVARQRNLGQVRERSARLAGFARRALKKAAATERARRRTLAQAEEAEDLRRRGELILANLHAIRPGEARVTVTDYYHPDQASVELELDPHYSPQENAKALFERYKRARRVEERVPPLLRRAVMEREYLEGVLDQLETASTLEDLAELEAELDRGGYIGRQAKRRSPRVEARPGEPRRIASSDGLAILYGTTGTQNDALVRMADGDDIWLHVREGPGGHVLIRTGGRPDAVPERTLQEAAGIAAAHSRWRSDARAEVAYTLARHVRKPRGAPPGFVTYTDFQTITAVPRRPR